MSDEYNAMYETKYNECHYELTKAQREVQYHKNEIENLHKNFSESLERKSNVGMDEALMRDIAEWEKKKKKESGMVEKLEKDIRTLKEENRKYKKSIDKYKKQMLKLMASKLDESDTDDISSIGS
jgi:chromosome segregation ATPase